MIARTLLVPSVVSLAALVGCGGDDLTETKDATQIGKYTIPVKGDRVMTAMASWSEVEKRVGEVPGAGVLEFVPLAGVYKVNETVIHADECGIDPANFTPVDHGVRNVNKRTGVYLTDYIDAGDIFDTLGCELNGHFYRCQSSTTAIDFNLFGLDAVVFIDNGDFGTWSGQTDSFLGLNPYTIRCKGGDCDKEPASNLFGFISSPMPCTGIDGQKLALQP